jgi:hypothetical protein
LPLTGSLSLQDSTVTERNNLVADCVAAQIAREHAVERGTHEKQDWAWRRWKEYILSIGIKNNLFLENFSREHRHIIIGVFAMAVREARFSRASHERLAAGTVKDTMQFVCANFFKTMGTKTHPSTTTGSLHSFYSENLGHSKILIQKKSTKKQYPCQSSASSSTETAQNSSKPLAN